MSHTNAKYEFLPEGTVLTADGVTYTIQRVLGNGAFGITYLADCDVDIDGTMTTMRVALKEHYLRACYRDDDKVSVLCHQDSRTNYVKSLYRFMTEATNMRTLCNLIGHIANVSHVFLANNTAYYAMEYLEGGTLGRTTDKGRALYTIGRVAMAVKIMHDNGMLHLDIKPSNIMFRADDGSGHPYPVLIDFGSSTPFMDNDDGHQRWVAGATTGYAPIEQYDSMDTMSPAMDIYALGATLYYMLTGQNPPHASALAHGNTVLAQSLTVVDAVEFIPVVTRAMAYDMGDRYPRVDDMLSDLAAIKTSGNTAADQTQPQTPDPTTSPMGSFEPQTIPDWVTRDYAIRPKSEPTIRNTNITEALQVLHNMVIARQRSTGLYGILDSDGHVVVDFRYTMIGQFVEKPRFDQYACSDGTRWCIAAPFRYELYGPDMGTVYGWFEFHNDGLVTTVALGCERQYVDRREFPDFGLVSHTLEVLRSQTLTVGGKELTLNTVRQPLSTYGVIDGDGYMLAPMDYDYIEPFKVDCYYPGEGTDATYPTTTGAVYRIGDNVGFLRIEDNGRIVDALRYRLGE